MAFKFKKKKPLKSKGKPKKQKAPKYSHAEKKAYYIGYGSGLGSVALDVVDEKFHDSFLNGHRKGDGEMLANIYGSIEKK